MHALAAYLAEREREEAREIYMGDMLCGMLTATCRPSTPFTTLSELMREERTKDRRTGREIVQTVLARLKG